MRQLDGKLEELKEMQNKILYGSLQNESEEEEAGAAYESEGGFSLRTKSQRSNDMQQVNTPAGLVASRMTSQSLAKTEEHPSAIVSPKGSVRDYRSHISNFPPDDNISSHTVPPQPREEATSARGGSVGPSHHNSVVGGNISKHNEPREPSHHSLPKEPSHHSLPKEPSHHSLGKEPSHHIVPREPSV
jgi:hypothetical protein